MHLEFKLPTGAGGMAAGHYSHMLRKKINAWAQEHNVTVVNYVSGYRICFEFADDRDYTLFALTWQAKNIWHEYTLVKP